MCVFIKCVHLVKSREHAGKLPIAMNESVVKDFINMYAFLCFQSKVDSTLSYTLIFSRAAYFKAQNKQEMVRSYRGRVPFFAEYP